MKGGSDNASQIELSSPWYQEAGPVCKLSVALHMNNMEDGNLKIVVETRNHTWVIVETLGLGAFAMAGAPALARYVGGSVAMARSFAGASPGASTWSEAGGASPSSSAAK